MSLSTVGNYLNGKGSGHRETPANGEAAGGSFEFKAASLVELGRRLDAARAAYEPAKAELDEAARRWEEAVERLTAANGGS